MELRQRQYQVSGVNELARKIQQGIHKIIYQLATGGGKTVAFAGLTDRVLKAMEGKVVILVHREELLKQARRTLYEWYDIVAIPVTAGSGYFPNARVNVAMVETAFGRLKKNPQYFGKVTMVIVDEAHRGEFKKIYKYFPDAYIIGFTATPLSGDKTDPLKNYFSNLVCGIDIPELIEMWRNDHTEGLVPNRTICIKNVNRKELKSDSKDFVMSEMSKVYSNSKHVLNCLAAYKQHAEGKKTIIFNCDVDHSKKVMAVFESFGYDTRHLDGKTPRGERTKIIEWFKNTPGAILHNVDVATTGFDEKSIECVITNYSTESDVKWLQTCGRGSRPFPGKEEFLILDMGGNGDNLGDWCEVRNWKDLFFNPPKPGDGKGECPSKTCVGCSQLIPTGLIICKYCGAENKRKVVYDETAIASEDYSGRKLPDIYVEDLIKFNLDKKPFYVLHQIKQKIVYHAKHKWRLKSLDDLTAAGMLDTYATLVAEWCDIGKEKFKRFEGYEGARWEGYKKWHQKISREWIEAEMKRMFSWEPNLQTA